MEKVSKKIHPVIVFILGVFAGAVIVGLLFFYKVIVPVDYESSVLRNYYNNTPSYTRDYYKSYDDVDYYKNRYKFFSKYYNIGTPDGN